MILQALTRYYQRLIDQRGRGDGRGIAPFGYSPEKVSYVILLAPDGSVVDVHDIQDTTGTKPQPRVLNVPQPPKRTSNIAPCLFWDKSSYVLGVSATSKRTDKEHEAFKTLHEEVLAGEIDAGLAALLAFMRRWSPARFQPPLFSPSMLDANFVFRLDGEPSYLHERPAAKALRGRLLNSDEGDAGNAAIAPCLVTGGVGPVARLHPSIKGVRGAQSSGASIISFEQEAFTSYGKSQGENAPVSEQAAFAYTTALNHLLRRGEHNRQCIQIGDASVVFWAETDDSARADAAESLFAYLLNPPPDDSSEAAKLHRVLDAAAKGRPLAEIDPQLAPATRMCILGLAPNASRLSVRFWQSDTLELLTRRLGEHERDLRVEPCPWRTAPAAYRLVLATVPNRDGAKPKSDDAVKNLVGELIRAILSGSAYPRNLLANTVMRIRADGNVSGLRAAICKGVLTRERRLGIRTSGEEIPVSLDKQSTQPGYLLGRLFAVLEHVQFSALGGQVNATIRDRYYGAASAAPASIFPILLRNTQNHMSKLRKKLPRKAEVLERDIRDIVAGLPDQFPRSLRIEDQGRFAIGYYHQSQAHFTKRDPDAKEATGPRNDDFETEAQGEPL